LYVKGTRRLVGSGTTTRCDVNRNMKGETDARASTRKMRSS